jgi:hypothetical protein
VDLLYVGECKVEKNFLFALLMASVGDRPLGVEAAQLNAVARWATKTRGEEVTVHATGPRTSLVALTAAALDPKTISRVEMTGGLASLKEAIEQNRGVDQWPEVFCFGLLETTDVKHLVALTAPRPVVFRDPNDRAKKELAGLAAWYKLQGKEFDPLGK